MPLLAPMSIACLCLANFLAALESSVLSFMEHTACLTDQTLCVSAHGASNSTLMFSSSCILRKLFYLLPCQVLRTGIFCHVKFCVPVSSAMSSSAYRYLPTVAIPLLFCSGHSG
eukprot:scpid97375/ scgid1414/ 